MLNAQQQSVEAEERAMLAERDLCLAQEALRVQSDLARAADNSAAATANRTLSPGQTSRFPVSNHALPLATSPVLRAPPPLHWGSRPVPGGGTGEGEGGEDGGGVGGGALEGRTQEMGVRFALDTLKYSEDEEVVIFMLYLVQVGGRGEGSMMYLTDADLLVLGRLMKSSGLRVFFCPKQSVYFSSPVFVRCVYSGARVFTLGASQLAACFRFLLALPLNLSQFF